jgi:hypothetical protein
MAKGGSFEREVMKKLSLWWTHGERDDMFARTMGSGGYATLRKRHGKDTAFQTGDITFADPLGAPFIEHFCLECKTGYAAKKKKDKQVFVTNWCVLDILDSLQKEPFLMQIWGQALGDAEVSNREPLLIFRRFRMKPCICFKSLLLDEISDVYGAPPNYIEVSAKGDILKMVCIMNLYEFLDWCKDIRKVRKEMGVWQSKQSPLKTSSPTKKPKLHLTKD